MRSKLLNTPTALRWILSSIVLLLFVQNSHSQLGGQLFRRFEYKHSFRTPNLAQRDGSIPFWVVTGDAIASSEQLRLAPSMRSRKGIAWNKRAMVESENFEMEIALKVTGQGRIGADGLAIWYTHLQGTLGPVFGANDYWNGMGLMLDSFDNDGQRNNPYVSVMINDGTRSFDHQTDGSQQTLSGCQKDFRNKPFPVHVKVTYLNHVLTVMVTDGMTQEPRYELCLRAENIFLPKSGYFGVSAATGGLADDHDILDFSVYSLFTEADKTQAQQQIPQDERTKYDAEFDNQMKKFEEERKKFKEEHPDKARDDEEDPSKYYEDTNARELRLIYESQTAIHRTMQQMELKLQEINQQQHVHTSLIQQGSGAAVAQQQVPQGGAPPPPPQTGGFQQHEKNEVINSLRDLTTSVRDMKNYVNEIFTRTYNLEQKLGTGAGAVRTPDDSANIRQNLDNLVNEVRQIRSTQLAQTGPGAAAMGGCANLSCISSTLFMVIVAVQSGVILAFIFLRQSSSLASLEIQQSDDQVMNDSSGLESCRDSPAPTGLESEHTSPAPSRKRKTNVEEAILNALNAVNNSPVVELSPLAQSVENIYKRIVAVDDPRALFQFKKDIQKSLDDYEDWLVEKETMP